MVASNRFEKPDQGSHRLAVSALMITAWTISTILWSIFTLPVRTYPIRILLFQPTWLLRILRKDLNWFQDLVTTLLVHAVFSSVTGIWRLPSLKSTFNLSSDSRQIYLSVFSLLGACGALAGAIGRRGHQLEVDEKQPRQPLHRQIIDEQLIPPLLIPSRTTHSRLFPKKHSFGYSYFLVGIPVGLRGRVGSALSVDSESKAWFDISADDYLIRGISGTLAEKLHSYLHTQGVTDREYSFAYLVTAPRFAGYSFNPVSFWYLYDNNTKLKFMILEVNNTFDERRMYLLRTDPASTQLSTESADPLDDEHDNTQTRTIFTETWSKDFHVSPFNSRKGSYSLRAVDPLAAVQEGTCPIIDNTIVLRSSKQSAKIVARVFSTGEPSNAAIMAGSSLAKLVASWFWVGFATVPRILWEARALYFGRQLYVWLRPEVDPASIGRNYTDDELKLEQFFQAWLELVVEQAITPLRVVYRAPHRESDETVLYSPGFTYQEDHGRTLTISILTPAFYSRFVHYTNAKEAFDRESLATEEKNRTAVIENAILLPIFLVAVSELATRHKAATRSLNPYRYLSWIIFRAAKCPPPSQIYPSITDSATEGLYMLQDIRRSGYSEFDTFVKRRCRNDAVYRRIATKLFLAQRIFYGITPGISLLDFIFRATLVVAALAYCSTTAAFDVLRPEYLGSGGWPAVGSTLLLANSIHLWEFAKG
ncbi:hypothetical protein K431DRAFT_287344 [Polychaeton citri CBS 116435]|uniref:DUF1365-domain-containing protein n=1 Tax=Polychaeton citri CBS 116435 TaxID=1314669 RepID=A0A9P4Q3A1_9PEZI|nr:hypothetical protein K431DRAFT_287344 [Polychaeton citri CBS 116435]